jgi:hypothetical protein
MNRKHLGALLGAMVGAIVGAALVARPTPHLNLATMLTL